MNELECKLIEWTDGMYSVCSDGSIVSVRTGKTMKLGPNGTVCLTWGQLHSDTVRVLPIVAACYVGVDPDQHVIPRDLDWTNTHPDNAAVVDHDVLLSLRRHAKALRDGLARQLARERRELRRDLGLTVRNRRTSRSKNALMLSRFDF